ncbi:hypothetical protein ARMGADRAFT_53856 [Armillaria gallica]|uniref:Uncharacterized protein n=1 Tax=Armillaria gallica TaxID=47427 RepID=A0A2H3EEJ7_ARMGA|nr:hypothetical protein ARMGADRAFT_53856 [Armillaria gallica]
MDEGHLPFPASHKSTPSLTRSTAGSIFGPRSCNEGIVVSVIQPSPNRPLQDGKRRLHQGRKSGYLQFKEEQLIYKTFSRLLSPPYVHSVPRSNQAVSRRFSRPARAAGTMANTIMGGMDLSVPGLFTRTMILERPTPFLASVKHRMHGVEASFPTTRCRFNRRVDRRF